MLSSLKHIPVNIVLTLDIEPKQEKVEKDILKFFLLLTMLFDITDIFCIDGINDIVRGLLGKGCQSKVCKGVAKKCQT